MSAAAFPSFDGFFKNHKRTLDFLAKKYGHRSALEIQGHVFSAYHRAATRWHDGKAPPQNFIMALTKIELKRDFGVHSPRLVGNEISIDAVEHDSNKPEFHDLHERFMHALAAEAEEIEQWRLSDIDVDGQALLEAIGPGCSAVAEHFGVSKRHGRRIVAEQIRRAAESGDLFAGVV